jgi:drug/metabolite transporter (DMT)-like permease
LRSSARLPPFAIEEDVKVAGLDFWLMRSKSYFCDVLLLTVIGIWGFNFAIVKVVYAEFHPLAFNALRFVVASLTMLALLKLRGESFRIDREDRKGILGLALLANTLYQFLFVIGLANTKAGNAGLLMALTPVFAYLVGVIGKRDRFSRNILGGIILSLAGVIAIVLAGSSNVAIGKTWKGDLLLMGAAFCWGWYTGAASRLLAKYGALRLTVLTMIPGTLIMLPLSMPWIVRQKWTGISANAWAGFLYSTLLAIVYAYCIWAYAISRIGAARTAVFSNLTPIVALFGGWLLLREVPSTVQLAGVACVLTGVFIVRSYKPPVLAVPDE